MKLVVFGASGRTGRLVVEQALAAGHEVTAFVRDPAKLNLKHERLRVVQGDSTDRAKVEQAIAGNEVVISALGPVKNSAKDLLQNTNRNIVQAMRKLGVRRIVTLTGAGVRDPQDQPKLVDKIFGLVLRMTAADVLKDSQAGVDVVRSSDLDWTVVRAPRLVDAPKTGKFRVGYVGAESGTQITRADLADFMLRQTSDTGWLRKMPMVSA